MISLAPTPSHGPVDDARPMLRRVVMAFAVAALLCAVAMTLDERVLDNGHDVWLKPLRFCVAFGVHLATLWWLASLTRRQEAGDRWFGLGARLQAGTALLELACIALQAGRGVHSHFNYTTPFDHAVFTVMGLGTALVLAGMALMVAGLVRWPADRVITRATIAGLSIAVLGGLVGVWMVMPTPEQRGLIAAGQKLAWAGSALTGLPSAQSLPVFGWDLHTGDWRVPHFIGLHGLQALPALAWLQRRAGRPTPDGHLALWLGAAAYLMLFIGAVVWTAGGRSALDAGVGSALLVGLPLAVYLTAAGRLLARHGA
jgi:hypothetical protein